MSLWDSFRQRKTRSTGSSAEAVSCFQKAIEINPNRLMHYIELGQTYAQMGNIADARRLIGESDWKWL